MGATPLRVGLAVVMAGAAFAVAACGDDDQSEVCEAYSQLESNVEVVQDLGSGSSLEDVRDAVSNVVSDVDELRSAAASDPEVSAAVDDVEMSVDRIEDTVASISDGESAVDALGRLVSELGELRSSLDALRSAASCE